MTPVNLPAIPPTSAASSPVTTTFPILNEFSRLVLLSHDPITPPVYLPVFVTSPIFPYLLPSELLPILPITPPTLSPFPSTAPLFKINPSIEVIGAEYAYSPTTPPTLFLPVILPVLITPFAAWIWQLLLSELVICPPIPPTLVIAAVTSPLFCNIPFREIIDISIPYPINPPAPIEVLLPILDILPVLIISASAWMDARSAYPIKPPTYPLDLAVIAPELRIPSWTITFIPPLAWPTSPPTFAVPVTAPVLLIEVSDSICALLAYPAKPPAWPPCAVISALLLQFTIFASLHAWPQIPPTLSQPLELPAVVTFLISPPLPSMPNKPALLLMLLSAWIVISAPLPSKTPL